MLNIKSLSKTYHNEDKKIYAIKDINLDINEGEFIALVGPSGCGKTTLLKCVAGILNPTTGKIILGTKKITSPDKDVGMVFQDFSLFPWLTVRENIEFGLKIRNIPLEERNRLVNHYLNVTKLKEFADTYPKYLSGGMKQRVAIARTLANNPKVILMDEPFGSLDNLTRSSMQEFLTELWEKEHKTILFVTHDVEEALFISEKVYILSKRPATIKTSFDVPFKRPRKHELKQSKEFFKLRNKIVDLLER